MTPLLHKPSVVLFFFVSIFLSFKQLEGKGACLLFVNLDDGSTDEVAIGIAGEGKGVGVGEAMGVGETVGVGKERVGHGLVGGELDLGGVGGGGGINRLELLGLDGGLGHGGHG